MDIETGLPLLFLKRRSITERESPPNQLEYHLCLACRWIWSEAAPQDLYIKRCLTRQENSREDLLCHHNVEGRFVIAQPCIKFRLVGADKLGFGEECIKLCLLNDEAEFYGLGEKETGLGWLIFGTVGTKTPPEIT